MTRARDLADIGDGVISANSSTTAFEIRQLGSGNAFAIEDDTNPDSTPFVITANGSVGIGLTNPTFPIHIKSNSNGAMSPGSTSLLIEGDVNNERIELRSSVDPVLQIGKSLGTMASPLPPTSGYELGRVQWGSYDTTSWFLNRARVGAFASEAWTSTTTGTDIYFTTTLNGTTTPSEKMRIDNAGSLHLGQILENATISATAATGTMAYDVITNRAVLYYTSNANANWTWNFRGNSTRTLNSMMNIGQTLTIATLITNGSPAYYQNSQCQIDGTTSGVTQRWQGGTAPTSGNTNSIDVYTHTIIKTANATFTVLSSQTRF